MVSNTVTQNAIAQTRAVTGTRTPQEQCANVNGNVNHENILAEGAMILSVTLSGDVLFAN